MSIQAIEVEYPQVETLRLGEDDHGRRWVLFASAVLGLVGLLNFIEGIAAIGSSRFFVPNAQYIVGNLQAWGWVLLVLGAAQVAAALTVVTGNQLARWAGLAFAFLDAVAQHQFLPADHLWSVTLLTLDVLAMYGLAVYGGLNLRPV